MDHRKTEGDRVRTVASATTASEIPALVDAGAGDLSLDFDDAISLLTLSVSPQAVLRIWVSTIDLSVIVTDEQIGERSLTMCL